MIFGNDTDAFIQIKFDLFDKQLNPLLCTKLESFTVVIIQLVLHYDL
jgi:hypothetical protein